MDKNPVNQTSPQPIPEEIIDSTTPDLPPSSTQEPTKHQPQTQPVPDLQTSSYPEFKTEDPPPLAKEPTLPPTPVTTYQTPSTAEHIDINLLSNDQLKAAAALFTKRNQAEISRKGVAKRKETMQLNQREIVDFLSLHNGSPLPRIAKHTNITPGTTSKYLRQLIASGKVRAEGWAKTRRYYLN